MKIIRSLIIFLTLFVGLPSIAMDCDICFEPISAACPKVSMCPNAICDQAHPTCKECHLKYFKKDQCVYKCNSTSTCVACVSDLVKDGVLTSGRFCSLDCGHFVCYTCIKDKSTYACSVCNRSHDAEAIKKIKSPRNSGEAKKALKAYVEDIKKTEPIKKNPKSHKKPSEQANQENCPICHQNKDDNEFLSIGCSVNHRYCIACLPGTLTHYNNCPVCNEHITNKDRIRLTDEIARHKGDFLLPSQKNLVRIGGLAGLSVVVLPWITHYWAKYCLQFKLIAVDNTAQNKMNKLLNFEFDCDDNGASFLGLQESFDINKILSALKTEEQRVALKTAIERYDIALAKAYDRIISTYYYQPAINFEQKEPELVQELKASTEQINKLITNYVQELGRPMRNMLLGIGIGALSGIGILQITKK